MERPAGPFGDVARAQTGDDLIGRRNRVLALRFGNQNSIPLDAEPDRSLGAGREHGNAVATLIVVFDCSQLLVQISGKVQQEPQRHQPLAG